MTPSFRFKDPRWLIRVGLLFLILASGWKWFVRPSRGFPDTIVDGITGLLYGISIGCLLLGIARGRRRGERGPRA
jgi:peptidoglycan/LPS O-acetylase OafA/YrhL